MVWIEDGVHVHIPGYKKKIEMFSTKECLQTRNTARGLVSSFSSGKAEEIVVIKLYIALIHLIYKDITLAVYPLSVYPFLLMSSILELK